MKKEYKDFDFELKQAEEDEEFYFFEGYAATFHDIDSYEDRFMPGAFSDSLKSLRPIVLWQHRTAEPIGISLQETEDSKGLFVKAKLPKNDTFVAGRVWPQIKIKSVNKLSIGFSTLECSYEKVEGFRWDVRNITKAKLYEYSPVSIPANMNATITDTKRNKLFTYEDVQNISRRELNRILKETGLFTKAAREELSRSFPGRGNPDTKGIEIFNNFNQNLKKLTILAKN